MGELTLANVEASLVSLLSGPLGTDVATKVPNPRPTTFVRVGRVGGASLNLVQERPLLLVECWGRTDYESWQLAAKAWQILSGREPLIVGEVELSQRSLSTPVNYPDPATSSARYQFTVEATVNLVKELAP
jgi:hypothetical protein